MLTIQQKRARTALAVDVGPAIVWTTALCRGPAGTIPILVSTDTSPGLDLHIWPGGGIGTPYRTPTQAREPRYPGAGPRSKDVRYPLAATGATRMQEAMADDERRVLRIIRAMLDAVATAPAREAVMV